MANNKKQHIFLVDDEPKILKLLSETLSELGLQTSCFARAADCLKQFGSQRCDLVIADLKMPEIDGIDFLNEIKRISPWLPVIIISGYGNIQIAVKSIKLGAVDFVEKPFDKKCFLAKVNLILEQNNKKFSFNGNNLTDTELKVLKLIIEGKSNTEIAYLFHRSVRTIEVHRSNLMHKLDVDNVVDLMKRAAIMGLVELPTK
ncbi:MAG: response regulator [Sedimentisphaerales bacterium]|nr:response regulator [Sedimentisphaerales bacterium]